VQNTTAKFAHHRNDPNWEILTQRRKISRICPLFKGYAGERDCKAINDLSRVDHDRKIRSRKQKRDIGKFSFVKNHPALEPTTCRCFRESLL
jgi:hypothetical protein